MPCCATLTELGRADPVHGSVTPFGAAFPALQQHFIGNFGSPLGNVFGAAIAGLLNHLRGYADKKCVPRPVAPMAIIESCSFPDSGGGASTISGDGHAATMKNPKRSPIIPG